MLRSNSRNTDCTGWQLRRRKKFGNNPTLRVGRAGPCGPAGPVRPGPGGPAHAARPNGPWAGPTSDWRPGPSARPISARPGFSDPSVQAKFLARADFCSWAGPGRKIDGPGRAVTPPGRAGPPVLGFCPTLPTRSGLLWGTTGGSNAGYKVHAHTIFIYSAHSRGDKFSKKISIMTGIQSVIVC